MPHVRILSGLLFGVILAGCSTPTVREMTVRSAHDPAVKFPGTGSYGWIRVVHELPEDPRIHKRELEERIRKAIQVHLASKAYRWEPAYTPDFLVGYHVAVGNKLDHETMNKRYGYDPDWAWKATENELNESGIAPEYAVGSIVIDFVDYKTKKPVWRGSAQAEVVVEASREQKDRRINEAVRQILARFPPR